MVLLIHGDATPSLMVAPIAEALVAKGCKVILFGESSYLRQPK